MKQCHEVFLLFIDLVYTPPVICLETPTHAIRKAKYRQASKTYFVVAAFILFHSKAVFSPYPKIHFVLLWG